MLFFEANMFRVKASVLTGYLVMFCRYAACFPGLSNQLSNVVSSNSSALRCLCFKRVSSKLLWHSSDWLLMRAINKTQGKFRILVVLKE